MTDPFNGATNIEASRRLVSRCIEDLDAVGAKYRIVIDGNEYGDLDVAPIKPSARKKHRDWSEYGEYVRAMSAGESLDFKPLHGEPVDKMANALSGIGVHAFGRGNFKVVSNKINSTVSVKRIA